MTQEVRMIVSRAVRRGGPVLGPTWCRPLPLPHAGARAEVQDQSGGELFWKITTGRGPMPAWRHLPEADRWTLVRYIRTLAAR